MYELRTMVAVTNVSAGIIRNEKGEILICQRGAGGSCAHLWEFPGGKEEDGETPESCLVRECKEELSIEITPDELFLTTFYSYPEGDIYFSFFYASIVSGFINMKVHSSIKWVLPCELENYDFCPADATVLKRLSSIA